jgi:hypothetical protein
MGLKEQFQNVPLQIFSALGNIPEYVTYSKMTQNYAIPTNTVTETSTTYSVEVIFGTVLEAHLRLINLKKMNIKGSEAIIYLPGKNLTFKPANEDRVERQNGDIYVVAGIIGLTPTDALYTLLGQKLY